MTRKESKKVTINRYKALFPDEERDILDIARDLDIKCTKLIEERDFLLRAMAQANKIAQISSTITKGSAKNLTPRLILLESLVDEYYKIIGELSDESSCNKIDKK